MQSRVNSTLSLACRKAKDNKRQRLDDNVLDKVFQKLKKDELGHKRLPPHLVESAIQRLEAMHNFGAGTITTNSFNSTITAEERLTTYRGFVELHCRRLWDEAVAAKDMTESDRRDEDDMDGAVQDAVGQDLRVCDLSLDRLLREDLDEGARETIHTILCEKQRALSDHIDEVQIAVLKLHTEVRL